MSDNARALVVKLLLAWVRAGLPIESFIETATVAAPYIEGPSGRGVVGIRTDIADLAQVLTVWKANRKYLHRGRPRALPLKGAGPSMESLVHDTNPNFALEQVMEHLIECDSLQRVGRRYTPRSDARSVGGSRSSIVSTRGSKVHGASQGRMLDELATNLDHNFAPRYRWPSWYEFAAECANFPVSELEALSRFLYQQSDAFLRLINEYMHQRESTRDPQEPTRRVVVEIFESRSPNNEISVELQAALQGVRDHFRVHLANVEARSEPKARRKRRRR